jgi:hypothetical protein
VLLREADREPLDNYLECRLHLASGEMPPLKVVRAREVEMIAPAGLRWHLDDHNWPSAEPVASKTALSARCLAAALRFVAPPASFSDTPQAKQPPGS